MDPLTQGLLGAAAAQCIAPSEKQRLALGIGALAGMAPDLDVFIRSSNDPLLFLDYHRHFTHSLFFIPVGSMVVALFLFAVLRKKLPFKDLWLYSLLGYGTHALLDACTSYGTLLFWPLSQVRIAWDNVAVIDFFLTLPLGILVGLAFKKREKRWARLGLVAVVIYLLLGVVQRERIRNIAEGVIQQRGHAAVRHTVKPTLGNLWLWRSIYEYQGRYYVDALWSLPFRQPVHYPGSAIEMLDQAAAFPQLKKDSQQFRDLERFRHFSANYLAIHPHRPNVVADIRYALLPNDVTPLWGIALNLEQQHEHVAYETFREITASKREKYFKMLLGK